MKLKAAHSKPRPKMIAKPSASIPLRRNASRISAPTMPALAPTAVAIAFLRLKYQPRELGGTSSASQSLYIGVTISHDADEMATQTNKMVSLSWESIGISASGTNGTYRNRQRKPPLAI